MWYPLIVRNRPILWFGYFFSNPGTITVTNVPPRVRVRGRGALSPIPGVLVYHGNPSENMTRLHLVHPHKIQAFDWVASVDSRSSRCSTQRYERTVSQMPWDQRFLFFAFAWGIGFPRYNRNLTYQVLVPGMMMLCSSYKYGQQLPKQHPIRIPSKCVSQNNGPVLKAIRRKCTSLPANWMVVKRHCRTRQQLLLKLLFLFFLRG